MINRLLSLWVIGFFFLSTPFAFTMVDDDDGVDKNPSKRRKTVSKQAIVLPDVDVLIFYFSGSVMRGALRCTCKDVRDGLEKVYPSPPQSHRLVCELGSVSQQPYFPHYYCCNRKFFGLRGEPGEVGEFTIIDGKLDDTKRLKPNALEDYSQGCCAVLCDNKVLSISPHAFKDLAHVDRAKIMASHGSFAHVATHKAIYKIDLATGNSTTILDLDPTSVLLNFITDKQQSYFVYSLNRIRQILFVVDNESDEVKGISLTSPRFDDPKASLVLSDGNLTIISYDGYDMDNDTFYSLILHKIGVNSTPQSWEVTIPEEVMDTNGTQASCKAISNVLLYNDGIYLVSTINGRPKLMSLGFDGGVQTTLDLNIENPDYCQIFRFGDKLYIFHTNIPNLEDEHVTAPYLTCFDLAEKRKIFSKTLSFRTSDLSPTDMVKWQQHFSDDKKFLDRTSKHRIACIDRLGPYLLVIGVGLVYRLDLRALFTDKD